MGDELERMWKELALWKETNRSHLPKGHSNTAPPEYEAILLASTPRHSVIWNSYYVSQMF